MTSLIRTRRKVWTTWEFALKPTSSAPRSSEIGRTSEFLTFNFKSVSRLPYRNVIRKYVICKICCRARLFVNTFQHLQPNMIILLWNANVHFTVCAPLNIKRYTVQNRVTTMKFGEQGVRFTQSNKLFFIGATDPYWFTVSVKGGNIGGFEKLKRATPDRL